MANIRSNSQSNWRLDVAKPHTTSIGSGVPDVARFTRQIANIKARGEQDIIRINTQHRNQEFKEDLSHLELAGRYANKFSDVASKAYYDKQKSLFEAELKNDNLVATNIVGEYADMINNDALNPNGFMHTAYSPDNGEIKGTSSARSLTELHNKFFDENDNYKNSSPRVQQMIKDKASVILDENMQKALVRDAETRFGYELNTRQREMETFFKTSYANKGVSDWEKYLADNSQISDSDKASLKKFIYQETWMKTIASARDPEKYENFSDVFDYENGSYENPIVRNTAEAKEKYAELEKATISHWALGGIVSALNTTVHSDNDQVVELMFEQAKGFVEKSNLTADDKQILSKNLITLEKMRSSYLKERAIKQVALDDNMLVKTLIAVKDDTTQSVDDKISLIQAQATAVNSNLAKIAKADEKLAIEHGDEQLLTMAHSILNLIHTEYENVVDPLYNKQMLAATREIGTKEDGVYYETVTDAKADTSPAIEQALQLRNDKIEQAKQHPVLGGYIALAIAERDKNVHNLSKAHYDLLKKQITAGSTMDEYGSVTPLNYVATAIKIEDWHNKGIITTEQRKDLFKLAMSKQKLKDFDETEIKKAIAQTLMIDLDKIDDVFEKIPADVDYNLRENYFEILDIIPDKYGVKTRFQSKKNPNKLSYDAIFALYQLGVEYYTNAEMYTTRASFGEFLSQLAQKGELSIFNEVENARRLERIAEIHEKLSRQPASLWMNQSPYFDVNYPTK